MEGIGRDELKGGGGDMSGGRVTSARVFRTYSCTYRSTDSEKDQTHSDTLGGRVKSQWERGQIVSDHVRSPGSNPIPRGHSGSSSDTESSSWKPARAAATTASFSTGFNEHVEYTSLWRHYFFIKMKLKLKIHIKLDEIQDTKN